MKRLFSPGRTVFLSLFVAIFGVAAPDPIGPAGVLLWSIVCGVIVAITARRYSNKTRQIFLNLGVVLLLISCGIVVRTVHGLAVDQDQPIPSPADLIHIPAYVLFGVIAWQIFVARSIRRDIDAWLDSLAPVLSVMLLMWVGFFAAYVFDPAVEPSSLAMNSLYNLLSLIGLMMVLRVTATPGHRPIAYYLVGLSFFAAFVADIAATYSLVRGSGVVVSVAMSPFAYGLAMSATLHDSADEIATKHDELEPRIGLFRLVLLGGSIVAPIAVLMTHTPINGTSRLIISLLSLAITAIVMVRLYRLLTQQQRAADLEALLAAETSRLASFANGEEIRMELPAAFSRIFGSDAKFGPKGSPRDTGLRAPILGSTAIETVADLHTPQRRRIATTLLSNASLLKDSVEGIAALARQASERVANERIIENEKRFRALVQNSSDLILVVTPEGHLTYVSDSVERVIGHKVDTLTGSLVDKLVHKNDRNTSRGAFDHVLETGEQARAEIRLRTVDGSARLFNITATDMRDVDGVNGIVLNATDITENRDLEQDLRNAETIDSLTLLYNRAAFINELELEIRRTDVTGVPLAVAIVDLTDFKTVNDGFGPALADQALIECASRIRQSIRLNDTLARLSGDEFGVLMPDGYTSLEAIAVVERIVDALSEPFAIEGRPVALGASAGVTVNAGEDTVAVELLRNGDTALGHAKKNPGSVVLFEEEMGHNATERMELRNGFAQALKNDELRLVYQPIISMKTGEIVSLEALSRWTHPVRGPIGPGIFIPIAEESYRINELGEWALRTACEQLVEWDRLGLQEFTVSVNMSGHQLRDDSIISKVRSILNETGVSPERLVIEITESVLIDDSDFTASRISAIRGLGVKLAIDDFGTGYSSLSYLQRYEFDVLKIDRAFVMPLGIPGNVREREIVSSIIGLATGLGAVTVAEGIEEESEYAVIRELECDHAQGFLFYRPLEVPAVTERLLALPAAA